MTVDKKIDHGQRPERLVQNIDKSRQLKWVKVTIFITKIGSKNPGEQQNDNRIKNFLEDSVDKLSANAIVEVECYFTVVLANQVHKQQAKFSRKRADCMYFFISLS